MAHLLPGAGARFLHNMVWDPAVGKVIIYGGSSNGIISGNLSDTWSYTVATNSFAALAAGPPARSWAGMVNTTNGASVLCGGLLSSGVPDNRTWVYQSTGTNANTWTPRRLSPAPGRPTPMGLGDPTGWFAPGASIVGASPRAHFEANRPVRTDLSRVSH